MRIHRILPFGAMVLLLPQFALAERPFDNRTLGYLEGMFDTCSKAVPERTEFKQLSNMLEHQLPKKELEEIRNSQEYKGARESFNDGAAKANKDEVAKACLQFLESTKE